MYIYILVPKIYFAQNVQFIFMLIIELDCIFIRRILQKI